jgi:hypothetical protein
MAYLTIVASPPIHGARRGPATSATLPEWLVNLLNRTGFVGGHILSDAPSERVQGQRFTIAADRRRLTWSITATARHRISRCGTPIDCRGSHRDLDRETAEIPTTKPWRSWSSASSREVIQRQGPWRDLAAVEFATLAWVERFNHRRLLEPIGEVSPPESEE